MKPAIELATLLVNVADGMVRDRNLQLGNEAIRTLKEEVRHGRSQFSEGADFAVDYQAGCLIDCLAELAYARSDGDRAREDRAIMYINSFRTFLRIDRDIAERKHRPLIVGLRPEGER
jgi:hypothetical protein